MNFITNMLEEMEQCGVSLELGIRRYREAEPLESCRMSLRPGTSAAVAAFGGTEWTARLSGEGRIDQGAGVKLDVEFMAHSNCEAAAVSTGFRLRNWSTRNYVLVPGAVYGGNRFAVRALPYAPCWTLLGDDIATDVPPLITDVPRLSVEDDAPSAFHLLAGDAAIPMIACWDEALQRGWMFVTEQETTFGDTSLHLEESADRSEAHIRFQAPGVRPHVKYEMTTTKIPSTDRGHDFTAGQSVRLSLRIYRFPCASIRDLFQKYADLRRHGMPASQPAPSIPFSAAWAIQESKYNAMNWNEALGYYAVGTVDSKHQDWQIGWVGGGMSSYALLLEGSELSVQRALTTLDFIFSSQTSSGFFHGVCYKGKWYGDEFNGDPERPHPEQWHIVRKSADALYFLMKHIIALEHVRPDLSIPDSWLCGIKKLADAFVRLWRHYGQFGQWVHTGTGEILVGGSAAAGIAPAGLALCGAYFDEPRYTWTAKQAALYYYRNFTERGITNGGPGEILQCPDSESAFALLETYIVHYEMTGEREWAERANEAAQQAMTWCVAYDFRFPADSTFGRLGIRTTGSVIANVQNKHSAPGICTLSGDSLLKLYRATGNEQYMELLRDIAGNLPQYLSRKDRPIRGWDGHDMPEGYMSERVNMSDWEGKPNVGEVIPLSCWCEVSLMLSFAELPGVYVNSTSKLVTAIDQVSCELISTDDEKLVLRIHNPHPYPATVKLLAEDAAAIRRPLGTAASVGWHRITLTAGGTALIAL